MSSQKHIYIIGNNSLAKLLQFYLKHLYNIDAKLCLNKKYVTSHDDVVAIEDEILKWGSSNIAVYVAVAYIQNNSQRKLIYEWLETKNIEILSFIHPSCNIACNCVIGEGCIFLENVIVQPFVEIGCGNIFWENVCISHETHIGEYNYFAPNAVVAGRVTIMDLSFIGAGAILRNDIVIGRKCIIGAGAYAVCDLDDESVLVSSRSVLLDKKSDQINII